MVELFWHDVVLRCLLDVLCNLELVTIRDDAVLALVLDTVGNVTTRAIEVALVVLSVVGIEVVVTMGSATGGARGAMAPPKNGLGGPVMHLAPPIFWENSVMKHN